MKHFELCTKAQKIERWEQALVLNQSADARYAEAIRATAVAGKLEDLILVPVDVAD